MTRLSKKNRRTEEQKNKTENHGFTVTSCNAGHRKMSTK